jgi:hypothetical protein
MKYSTGDTIVITSNSGGIVGRSITIDFGSADGHGASDAATSSVSKFGAIGQRWISETVEMDN